MPSTVLWKTVKPTKLKQDAFRLEFLTALHSIERPVQQDFEKTVETWDHTVKFDKQISLRGGPSLLVGTDDPIYKMVNDGTPPHIIPAKAGGMLIYQPAFTPKTFPGIVGSIKGGKYGTYIQKEIVQHPGTEARKFDEAIFEKWQPKFKVVMEDAMKKGAQKCGHYIKD